MARIETWYNQDLKEPVKVQYLDGNVFSQDNNGNLIGVIVSDDGSPASLSGTVSASIIRPDGGTVTVSGTLSDNKASVLLPQTAYAYPGVISVIIKLTSGTTITTLCAVIANVYQSETDTVIDPGTIIPSIETLIAEIDAAVATIPADYSSLWKTLAPTFASGSYREGQYVTRSGKMYRFTKAHSGSWNSNDVEEVNIGNELDSRVSVLGFFGDTSKYSDLNTLPVNSFIVFYSTGSANVSHKPTTDITVSTIQVLTLSPERYLNAGALQIAIMRNASDEYRTYMRTYVSGAWRDWVFDLDYVNTMISNALPTYFHSIGLYGDNQTYNNIDTLPMNSYLCFFGTGATGLQNVPWLDIDVSTIQVATISTSDTLASGTIQILVVRDSDNNYRICVRSRISGIWKGWAGLNGAKIVRTVRANGSGNFTSVVSAIKWTMDNPPSRDLPVLIDIGEGEFSLSHVATLIGQNSLDSRGLFLMPYTTIQGKGPEKTILKFYYDGSSDTISSQVSGLNIAYESQLKDLSVYVKNLRYTFHADYALSSESSDDSNTKLKNNTFIMENVVGVHEGYTEGISPTYKVPAVWGGGLRTNQTRIFRNCVFESYEDKPWFVHDWTGISQGTNTVLDGCSFITHKQDSAAIRFISWGSGYGHNVDIKNCIANSFMSFGVNTSSNANATINYYVRAADMDILVVEDSTNNANKKENYYIGGTIKCLNYSGASITKFAPVRIQSFNKAYGYSSAGIFGIATHNAASGAPVNVQTKGFVNIQTSGFTVGTRLTYSGGAWVADADGEIMVLGNDVCMIC